MFGILDAATEHLKAQWRIACFVSDPYNSFRNKSKEDNGENILDAPYERGHSRSQMWAHYAENHAGACLILHKSDLAARIFEYADNSQLKVYSGRVTYRNGPLAPKLNGSDKFLVDIDEIRTLGVEAVSRHISKHLSSLFLTKATDWSAEREFRWRYMGQVNNIWTSSFAGALAGILLGPRFPRELEKEIGEYASTNATEVARMEWHNGVPQPRPTTARLLAAG